MNSRVKEYFASLQRKPTVIAGHVTSVGVDPETGQQTYAEIAVGSNTLRIRLDQFAPPLANGDAVRLEQHGLAASAEYKLAGIEAGARPGAGLYAVLNSNTQIGNGIYSGGDLVIGKLDGGNLRFEYETGRLYHRVGSNVYGIEYPNGSQLFGRAFNNGDWEANGANVFIDPTGIRLRDGLNDALVIDGVEGIRQYAGGVQRSHFRQNGSGWLGNQYGIFWDTNGNLSVSGALEAGPGSSILGDYIVAYSITADRLIVDQLSALAADLGVVTAGSIVIGSTNKLWLNDAADGGLALGGTNKATAPFRVSAAGVLNASSGYIGGWSIFSTALVGDNVTLNKNGYVMVGSGDNIIRLDSTDANWRAWVGNAVAANAPFRVSPAGDLVAANAKITGTIQAAVFEKSVMSAFAGGLIVAKSAGKLAAAYTVGGTMTIEAPPGGGWVFDTNDIVRIKATYSGGVGDTWITVTRTATENQYTTTYRAGTNSITYPKGTAVVDYGASGQGYFGVAADGAFGAAAAWVLRSHNGQPWSSETTHVYAGTDGKLYAGAGNVTLDQRGIALQGTGAAIAFANSGSDIGYLYSNQAAGPVNTIAMAVGDGALNTERLSDGGFESGVSDFTATTSYADTSYWQRDSSSPYAGSYCGSGLVGAQDFNTADLYLTSSRFSVPFGSKVRVQFRYKASNLASGANHYAYVNWYNASNTLITGRWGAALSNNASWTAVDFTDTPPGGAVAFEVVVRVSNWYIDAPTTINLDAFSIKTDAIKGQIAARTDGVVVTGDLKVVRNAAEYTGSVFVPLTTPLTSTSWDGDAFGTVSKTLIDLSAVFGVPAGVKAVLVECAVRDSASSGVTSFQGVILGPTNSANLGRDFACNAMPNDSFARAQGIVPCDANGDVYYQTAASGSGTLDVSLEIWGYWI